MLQSQKHSIHHQTGGRRKKLFVSVNASKSEAFNIVFEDYPNYECKVSVNASKSEAFNYLNIKTGDIYLIGFSKCFKVRSIQ